jgi:hypothetical protein
MNSIEGASVLFKVSSGRAGVKKAPVDTAAAIEGEKLDRGPL